MTADRTPTTETEEREKEGTQQLLLSERVTRLPTPLWGSEDESSEDESSEDESSEDESSEDESSEDESSEEEEDGDDDDDN
jgi:hypothetical protein